MRTQRPRRATGCAASRRRPAPGPNEGQRGGAEKGALMAVRRHQESRSLPPPPSQAGAHRATRCGGQKDAPPVWRASACACFFSPENEEQNAPFCRASERMSGIGGAVGAHAIPRPVSIACERRRSPLCGSATFSRQFVSKNKVADPSPAGPSRPQREGGGACAHKPTGWRPTRGTQASWGLHVSALRKSSHFFPKGAQRTQTPQGHAAAGRARLRGCSTERTHFSSAGAGRRRLLRGWLQRAPGAGRGESTGGGATGGANALAPHTAGARTGCARKKRKSLGGMKKLFDGPSIACARVRPLFQKTHG